MSAFEGVAGYEVLYDPTISVRSLDKLIERARSTVIALFGGRDLAGPDPFPRFAFFSDIDRLWEARVCLGAATNSPNASAICVRASPPLILVAYLGFDDGRAVVHELSHAWMASAILPRWLDEGLAMTAESLLGYSPSPISQARLAQALAGDPCRERWLTGKLFSDEDTELALCAYFYSYSITSELRRRNISAFSRHKLSSCVHADCGARWLLENFSLNLSDIFL